VALFERKNREALKEYRKLLNTERKERDLHPKRRWEYTTVSTLVSSLENFAAVGQFEARLNILGSKGWELVAAEGRNLLLKREIDTLSPKEALLLESLASSDT
jgi:hypothetical protein